MVKKEEIMGKSEAAVLDKIEKSGKSEKTDKIEKVVKIEKADKVEKSAKTEKVEKVEKTEKIVVPLPSEPLKPRRLQDRYDQFHMSVYKKVKAVSFGLLSPKMIRKMAGVKIVTPELYDKEGYPVDGGLMDIRLGVIDPGLRCKTCGSKLKECVGHFGYIELARPIMHIKFVPMIVKILKNTCRECGNILVAKAKIIKVKADMERLMQEHGASEVVDYLSTVNFGKDANKCPHCKARQYPISIEKPYTFMENGKRLSAIEIRTRLEKIRDEDCSFFSINPAVARPEWTVLTILAIPPVTMRPSITLESGERSEDDLTHKLGDIVRINQRLFENINAGAPEIIIEDLWDLLQYHITTFFDNEVAQLPPARHRSGQPLKTLSERIKSKEGRIRHNLTGKRVNFCARTVISPDPMIGINEVGVPKVVAMKLTVPETVTEWNAEYLKNFVKNGPTVYPGANYVVRPDGKKKKITDETKEATIEEIQPGYVIERHLLDGDVALFNRQPSLHRMSMMCHRVRVLPFRTLRLHPAVSKPYNADFDGDEMNLHIPQTEEARAEAEVLMEVQTQLISPGFGLSVIGCIQDVLSGMYLLTQDGVEIPHEEAIDILVGVGIDDVSRLPDKKMVTGRELVSVIIPEDFSFSGKSRSGEDVVIKNGELIKGVLDGATLGAGKGLLLRNLHKMYGPDRTIVILQRFFRLGTHYVTYYGFTTGIEDSDLSDEANRMLNDLMATAHRDVDDTIAKFYEGHLEVLPGRTAKETLELRILEILNKARNKAGDIVAKYGRKNTPTIVMANSGAKGTALNLVQMAAVVGQQALRGKRIEKGFYRRTMTCFKQDDLSPEAHGFIRSSFKSGLTPKEFFFGNITGRDSLMDTALRTPKSGYLYRRLANTLQDLRVEYDGTVRDSGSRIIQFKFGEDGLDVSRTERGKIDVQKIIDNV